MNKNEIEEKYWSKIILTDEIKTYEVTFVTKPDPTQNRMASAYAKSITFIVQKFSSGEIKVISAHHPGIEADTKDFIEIIKEKIEQEEQQ